MILKATTISKPNHRALPPPLPTAAAGNLAAGRRASQPRRRLVSLQQKFQRSQKRPIHRLKMADFFFGGGELTGGDPNQVFMKF